MLFYIFGVFTSDYADDQKSKSINSKRLGQKKTANPPFPLPKSENYFQLYIKR